MHGWRAFIVRDILRNLLSGCQDIFNVECDGLLNVGECFLVSGPPGMTAGQRRATSMKRSGAILKLVLLD